MAAGIAEIESGGGGDLAAPAGPVPAGRGGKEGRGDAQTGAVKGGPEGAAGGGHARRPDGRVGHLVGLPLREIGRRQMTLLGFGCGKDAIARMLARGRLQPAGHGQGAWRGSSTRTGTPSSGGISAQDRGVPGGRGAREVSVDGREEREARPVSPGRPGRWRPKGDPVRVPRPRLPRSGTRWDQRYAVTGSTTSPRRPAGSCRWGPAMRTAAFAVNALRLWWQQEGVAARYRRAPPGCWPCDAGGSNASCTGRLWKHAACRPERTRRAWRSLEVGALPARHGPARPSGTGSSTGSMCHDQRRTWQRTAPADGGGRTPWPASPPPSPPGGLKCHRHPRMMSNTPGAPRASGYRRADEAPPGLLTWAPSGTPSTASGTTRYRAVAPGTPRPRAPEPERPGSARPPSPPPC